VYDLESVTQSIPPQNKWVRFGVSKNNLLRLVPSEEEDDRQTIDALRAEMLDETGPINLLLDRYSSKPNAPQAELFRPVISRYAHELGKVPDEINYAVLYARGARLFAARENAQRQVESGNWPEFDSNEEAAIDAVCALHGPLIMASAVGRKLVGDAHEYEATPDILRKEQELIQQFGEALAAERELLEPDSAEAIIDLTAPIASDPQPARGRQLRLLVTGSALTAIVGGVAWLAAGGAAIGSAVPVMAVGAGMFLWEVVKKTGDFKKATDNLAGLYDSTSAQAAQQAGHQQMALLLRMRELVTQQKALFEGVAALRPEFKWATRYIKLTSREPFQPKLNRYLPRKVDDLELSVRSARAIRNDNIIYIGDLVQKTEWEMLRIPNFGRKSLNELKEVLSTMGLRFGMDNPGWPTEYIEEIMKIAGQEPAG
jgi:hypothetical protein